MEMNYDVNVSRLAMNTTVVANVGQYRRFGRYSDPTVST